MRGGRCRRRSRGAVAVGVSRAARSRTASSRGIEAVVASLLSLAPPPPPRRAGDEDTLSRRRPRATRRSLLYRLLFRFLVATARRFTGPPPPSRSLGLGARSPRTRRRIRPVPTPSSSLERRTGARRHAAGSWNARCGAPRTNAHGPLLCAVAPLRGVARLEWRDWPAPPPHPGGLAGGERAAPLSLAAYLPEDPARASALRKAAPWRELFFFFSSLCAFDQRVPVLSRAAFCAARPRRGNSPFPSRTRLPAGGWSEPERPPCGVWRAGPRRRALLLLAVGVWFGDNYDEFNTQTRPRRSGSKRPSGPNPKGSGQPTRPRGPEVGPWPMSARWRAVVLW